MQLETLIQHMSIDIVGLHSDQQKLIMHRSYQIGLVRRFEAKLLLYNAVDLKPFLRSTYTSSNIPHL